MDYAAVVFLEILYVIAILALISVGLAIIFGMMRVINLAHGEFLMLGGYATIASTSAGVNIWLRHAGGGAAGGRRSSGVVVERLVIRHLYGRMIDTMLATWGLQPADDRPGHR